MRHIPSVVQLPGGVRLQAVPFRVTAYGDDGSPLVFEIVPKGGSIEGAGVWWLFADEQSIRSPVPEEKRAK